MKIVIIGRVALLIASFLASWILDDVEALALNPSDGQSLGTLYDRFRTICPAERSTIQRYSSALNEHLGEDDGAIWAAVFRTSNNKPSVYVKDEFLQAMKNAVDPVETTSSFAIASDVSKSFEMIASNQAPVAVARLRPSSEFDDCWVLDSMRCILKKENTDASCDGGSEHTEAIAAAVDSLLVHYLSKAVDDGRRFDGAIRVKAPLVAGALIEQRGFEEVQTLQKDMATHISSLDRCMEKYAERSVDLDTKSPGARQRALSIVSCLGRLNRQAELEASKQAIDTEEDDYDPWAGAKRFL